MCIFVCCVFLVCGIFVFGDALFLCLFGWPRCVCLCVQALRLLCLVWIDDAFLVCLDRGTSITERLNAFRVYPQTTEEYSMETRILYPAEAKAD